MFQGELVAIFLAEVPEAALRSVPSATAQAGRGLLGDRYDQGASPRKPNSIDQITLIESETFEALQRDHGQDIAPHLARRNLLTRGVPLNHLVGRTFSVGDAVLQGVELCEPCGHLEKLTGLEMRTLLRHRGGLRAIVLQGAPLHVGDPITG